MPREYPRSSRVAEQLQRELSRLITSELQDPRLRGVTVTAVDVSRDLANARVYITVLGSDDAREALEALRHAAGKLRQVLGKALRMRYIPQLRFEQDQALIEGSRISALINKAVADDASHHDD